MAKVTGKPQGSRAVPEQPTPYTQEEKIKTSYQLRSKISVKVARATVRVNKHIQPKLTKEPYQKTPISKKLKKIGGSNLCSYCSKVNEELDQNEPEEVPGIMETPAIPARPVGSQ
ncbi:hypothetical protein CapIbe_023965 [Capra ibex]